MAVSGADERTYLSRIGSVLAGMAVAQAIPVVASLAIARLFSPGDFGTYSSWLGVALLLSVVVTGRFEQALALVEDGVARTEATYATLYTSVLASGALAIASLAAWIFLGSPTENPLIELMFLAFPVGLGTAWSQVLQSWAAADGRYSDLTKLRVLSALLVAVLQVAVGVLFPSAFGMAAAHLGGVCLAVAAGFYLRPLKLESTARSTGQLLGFWRRYSAFPSLALPADAINTASAQLPVFLLGLRFGAETAGQLALTFRVLGAPIGLLARAVLDVFKRHAAQAYRDRGECRQEYVRTFSVLTLGSLATAVVFALTLERLFEVAFGPGWQVAGGMGLWLLPMFALRFIASPLSYMVYIAERQEVDLLWQAALLLATILTLRLSPSVESAVKWYGAAYSALYVLSLWLSFQFSKGRVR